MTPSQARLCTNLVSVCLCATLLSAQTHKPPKPLPPSAFKLVSINVTGTKRYTPDEILAASGLELGTTVSEDDFKRVSQQLGESGAFSDVVYSFSYSPAGTKLELQLSDSDKFVPARFENFVWFPDQELMTNLRQRVALFKGDLPVAGNTVDLVSDALQAMLIEHGVKGRAEYLKSGPDNGPIEAVDYSVSGVNIRIRQVDLPDAGAAELPFLAAAAEKMEGGEYLRSRVSSYAQSKLRPIYLERGYLKASFADPQAKVAEDNSDETLVDLTLPVDPGRQYKLAELRWSGNTAMPVEKLQSLIHAQMGQPANAVQLAADLEAVKKAYGTHGYMAAGIKSAPELDDAQGTVAYQLEVREGAVYRMGDLEILGLDTRARDRLRDLWVLRRGEPYDATYSQRFLDKTANELPTGIQWDITVHEALNEEDKTVDVTLRFAPKGPR